MKPLILLTLFSVIYMPVFEFYSIANGVNSNQKAINIYWNVPSSQCMKYGLNFTELLDKYNIIHNSNDDFRGDMITILYDPGNFPAIIINKTGTHLRNAGVPQAGNLSDHLQLFEQNVIELIPDDDNAGLGIIDHELWKPIYRQNSGDYTKYQILSQDLVKEEYPNWSDKAIIEGAKKRFNVFANKFMVETLKSAKKLRRKVSWGYYHFPYCFTNGTERQCNQEVRDENDSLMEIYELSDNLYPSVYLKSFFTEEEHVRYIETSMVEAIRIRHQCDSDKKIFVYFWYKFTDTRTFIPREDLVQSLTAMVKYNIHGIILWGANADVNSTSGCEEVYEYIDHTFGPILQALFKF